MAMEPTHPITFDPTTLTESQRDGIACVVCGLDYVTETTPTPHVPAGMVDGGQVFACASHDADEPPDPNACVTCGRDFTTGRAVVPNVPARRVGGVLLFACVTCPQGDDEQPVTATVSGTWPGGEPESVRDMERRGDLARRADDLARRLEVDLGNVRDVDLATAVRAAITAMRDLGDACRSDDDEQLGRALDDSSATLRRLDGVITDRERRAE